MIEAVTAQPGQGKSLYAVHVLTEALQIGTPVASNVNLLPGWEKKIAWREPAMLARPFTRRRFLKRAESHFFYSESTTELLSVRLRGKGEGRGLMVLDEAGDFADARQWSAKDRKEIISWFRQHRKFGWRVLLIVQHLEMLDKQIRDLVQEHTICRKLRETNKVWGMKVFPPNFFVAKTVFRHHAGQGQSGEIVLRRRWYRANWRREMYDTMATTSAVTSEAEDTGLWLPAEPNSRPEAATDGRTASAARPPAAPLAAPAPDRPKSKKPVVLGTENSVEGG